MTPGDTLTRSEIEETEPAPPPPDTIADIGLSREAIIDLVLKTLYAQGSRTGHELGDRLRLPFQMVDELLLALQQRRLIQVPGTEGHGRKSYVFDLTSDGRGRAREAMETNQYVGPAPVPMDVYREWVERQSVRKVSINRARIIDGFSHLVLEQAFIEQLGPAVNSAKSMFLYGDSGNGKTTIAEAIAGMMGGTMYVPYAVELEGHIIVVHDPVYHTEAESPAEEDQVERSRWMESVPDHDRRFARVRRPVVFAGGELTLAELDLQYDGFTKFYQAPFQMKANGGVLIIDDLGRQLVSPRDLLNRWIVPLEKRVDYLTLHTGHKFPVPMDSLLIFATNLDPLDLADEAFLRRIHYKIRVDSPEREQFGTIFDACCAGRGIASDPAAIDYIFERYYGPLEIAPRACHPRDIVDHVCDVARFLDLEPALTRDLLDRACASYFLDLPDDRGP